MEETAQLLDLIGGIYDAVLEPRLWTGVLERAASFVGGCAASIFWQDSIRNEGNVYYQFGADPQYVQLYFQKYVKLNPLNMAYLTLNVGEVSSNSIKIPPAEFFESRFYKEWVQPQGWIDNAFAILEKSTTSIGAFNVFRHERDGLADDDARRRLGAITPHLRRAALIGKVVDLKACEAATFADMLDALAAGIFLLDATGRVVHTNAAGRDIFAAGDMLRSVGCRLIARDPQVNQVLHDAFTATEHGDEAVGAQGVAVPMIAHDGARHLVHLLNLTSGERRRSGIAVAATVAVFVHKAALETPSRPEAIARAYKLTPTELRVLLALIEVGGGPGVAEALGIADATVKTHLGHLFRKTGAARQADLVKLVAGFSSPLID
jgi:DNA-binding CsgD family transcriptional regulator/PAS domain-containing protein